MPFQAQCSVLFTANQTVRAGKTIELKKTVDAAVVKSENVVKHVFVYKKTETPFELKENQYLLNEVKIPLQLLLVISSA